MNYWCLYELNVQQPRWSHSAALPESVPLFSRLRLLLGGIAVVDQRERSVDKRLLDQNETKLLTLDIVEECGVVEIGARGSRQWLPRSKLTLENPHARTLKLQIAFVFVVDDGERRRGYDEHPIISSSEIIRRQWRDDR